MKTPSVSAKKNTVDVHCVKNTSQKRVCGPTVLVYELWTFARLVSLFPSKTAIGLDRHAFTDIENLTDNALDSLGEIIRQCFVKLAIPTQSLLQLLVLLGRKMEGAEPFPSCTQHTVSPCAWYQHTSVNGCQVCR